MVVSYQKDEVKSNHVLMIENDRHVELERDERLCPFCPSFLETEEHLVCKTFAQFHGGKLYPRSSVLIVKASIMG